MADKGHKKNIVEHAQGEIQPIGGGQTQMAVPGTLVQKIQAIASAWNEALDGEMDLQTSGRLALVKGKDGRLALRQAGHRVNLDEIFAEILDVVSGREA